MGTLHYFCSVVVLLTLVAVRLSVSSPDDQCQFIFKDDSVLDVERSQNDGAKVTTDLHVEDKVKCAEACCDSEGEWCTLAVFHTKTGPKQMNCFLVQCVPDGGQNNVCVTKHVRHSGFITADVKHLQDQKLRLLDHLLYLEVDSKQRARRSLYPDLLEEPLSRSKIRSHIQTVSSSISDSSASTAPVTLSSASRSTAFYLSSSPTVPASSSLVSSTVSSSMSSQTSSPTSSSSAPSSSSSPSSSPQSSSPSSAPSSSSLTPSSSSSSTPPSSSSSSLTLLSLSPSSSSFTSSRSPTDKSLSLPKTASVSSLPGSNHGNSSMEVTISSSSLMSPHPSSNTATPPTSPPTPATTPSSPPPPPPYSSPDTPPKSLHAPSSSTVAPKSLTSASSATPTSLTISANDSVEALNNLNAALNSSLTSPSPPSNPAPASITPKPSPTPAATDIPSHEKPTTVKATTKATTKAPTTATPKATTKATTQAVVADTTPTPKWSSPASLAANKTSDSNATQPINATQSGQDQTKSPEEVNSSSINRTTVTQTGILIVTLCFGIIFLLAMMVVVGKRWCEGYQRRKYSKVDYLINGYYS